MPKRGKKQQKIEESLTDAPASEAQKAEAPAEEPEASALPKKAARKRGVAEAPAGPAEHETAEDEPAVAEKEQPTKKPQKGRGSKKAKAGGDQQEEDKAMAAPEEIHGAAAGGGGSSNLPDNTLEQGRVFFMYKPKVMSPGEEPSISGLNDIQRTYLLLQPEQPSGGKCRLLVLPKKKMPDAGKHERFFAFLEAVASSPSELTSGLGEEHYTTKTKGERVQPGARAVGEGPYVIAKGGKSGGVHWGYKLDVPQEPGQAQKALGIRGEGSYVISAKNPEKQGQPGVPSAGPAPDYSPQQREKFGSRAWIGVEDTSLLDVAGTELLSILQRLGA
eukprot:GHUV01040068.1.p1 GENE.GHUV01040068.1~~GHUV01040068.1.p1  ORF type:complete len:332 (+),score=140.87 GHUV01040068.1:156-1151(+)